MSSKTLQNNLIGWLKLFLLRTYVLELTREFGFESTSLALLRCQSTLWLSLCQTFLNQSPTTTYRQVTLFTYLSTNSFKINVTYIEYSIEAFYHGSLLSLTINCTFWWTVQIFKVEPQSLWSTYWSWGLFELSMDHLGKCKHAQLSPANTTFAYLT